MSPGIVATGVTLYSSWEPLAAASATVAAGDEIPVEAEVWVEVAEGTRNRRFGGQTGVYAIVFGGDPTTELVEIAHKQRETNLGNAFGDARIAGHDVTRFECYSAPFRIELSDGLRELLSGTWDQRDPR